MIRRELKIESEQKPPSGNQQSGKSDRFVAVNPQGEETTSVPVAASAEARWMPVVGPPPRVPKGRRTKPEARAHCCAAGAACMCATCAWWSPQTPQKHRQPPGGWRKRNQGAARTARAEPPLTELLGRGLRDASLRANFCSSLDK